VFDLQNIENNLMPINHETWIGSYSGRKDGELNFSSERNEVFVFILSGVFEVENRLLQSRDALLLNKIHRLEFEALCNDAIIVISS
ncbi:MAG: hypothetical protein KDC80_00620, partial [Saprospiraceae bacterium]|nr:hypothetical protein [Saprospiraceae bacterium]